ERFNAKDRTLAEVEKELPAAQDALLQARKKLDRMLDWNTLLAKDRLNQVEIERLLKRQMDLAAQLEKLLAAQPKSDDGMAKQIEAIRAEEAALAKKTGQVEEQNRDMKEPPDAGPRMDAKRLAEQANQLAMEQHKASAAESDGLPAELKKRLDDL